MSGDGNRDDGVRLDRWLWAARFFKTRQLAAAACRGGKVDTNGQRAKPARVVQPGDTLVIQKEGQRFEVEVLAVAGRRLPATAAAGLYRESEQSIAARAEQAERQRTVAAAVRYDRGRPSKRDRRIMDRAKRSGIPD